MEIYLEEEISSEEGRGGVQEEEEGMEESECRTNQNYEDMTTERRNVKHAIGNNKNGEGLE